jgi:hypothetical protein
MSLSQKLVLILAGRQRPPLFLPSDRDRKFYGAVALRALERAHIEARLIRLNARKPHRLPAFGTPTSADFSDTEWRRNDLN